MEKSIKYEIVENLGVISENSIGWTKEINLVSWNNGKTKYDIRDWAPNKEKMGKGITLTQEEYQNLKKIITNI